MKHFKLFSDLMDEEETNYFCDSCGKTKTQPEIVNFVNSVTPQKISGLNIK